MTCLRLLIARWLIPSTFPIRASLYACQNRFLISCCWALERVVRAASRSSKIGNTNAVLTDVPHNGMSPLSAEPAESDAPFDERGRLVHSSVEMTRKAYVHSWR